MRHVIATLVVIILSFASGNARAESQAQLATDYVAIDVGEIFADAAEPATDKPTPAGAVGLLTALHSQGQSALALLLDDDGGQALESALADIGSRNQVANLDRSRRGDQATAIDAAGADAVVATNIRAQSRAELALERKAPAQQQSQATLPELSPEQRVADAADGCYRDLNWTLAEAASSFNGTIVVALTSEQALSLTASALVMNGAGVALMHCLSERLIADGFAAPAPWQVELKFKSHD